MRNIGTLSRRDFAYSFGREDRWVGVPTLCFMHESKMACKMCGLCEGFMRLQMGGKSSTEKVSLRRFDTRGDDLVWSGRGNARTTLETWVMGPEVDT